MKMRLDHGGSAEHVRVSGRGLAFTTIGSQNGVKSDTSASRSSPCTTSMPLTGVPGSIAAVRETSADAPVVTTSATRAIDAPTPRAFDTFAPMVFARGGGYQPSQVRRS